MLTIKRILIATFVCGLSYASIAGGESNWTLNNDDSRLSFVSTKIKDIPETHYFERMSGSISMDGDVSISLDAESINTGIEIRDDRMKEFLFRIVDFPSINLSANVDMAPVDRLADGETLKTTADVNLAMMGVEVPVKADLMVTKAGDTLLVSSEKPVLINAASLGLTDGVAKLAELAGGIEISNGVPVFFNLTFTN